MRIVHITTVPQSLRFLGGQVGFMKAQGFDIAAISSPGPELDQFGEQEEVPVHAVSMPRQIAPLSDLRAVARITSWLRRYRADIVHAHTPKGGLLGLISAVLTRVPVRFYHMRGLPFVTAAGWQRQLLKWTERTSCLLAHRVFCVSRSLREVAIAEGICAASKIVVLHHGGNGVDASARFNPARAPSRVAVRQRHDIPGEALVIGFVGRLVRDKGIVELADAWQELRCRHAHLHLLVVGRLESSEPVSHDIVSRLQEDARVHLVGYADSASLYPAMDLVVLPTYREGLPNVLLEAAAMKLPTVATHIPGCVDAVVDDVTGTLVPVRDVARLTAAIERYITDDDRRQTHGRAGRERVLRDFQPEAIWKALAQEYMRFTQTTDDAVSTPELAPPL
ncbi:MAG: glycosyltransferase [Luteitalea sp.]|nr:glycosyltransferase [Luteitalea sp.]